MYRWRENPRSLVWRARRGGILRAPGDYPLNYFGDACPPSGASLRGEGHPSQINFWKQTPPPLQGPNKTRPHWKLPATPSGLKALQGGLDWRAKHRTPTSRYVQLLSLSAQNTKRTTGCPAAGPGPGPTTKLGRGSLGDFGSLFEVFFSF